MMLNLKHISTFLWNFTKKIPKSNMLIFLIYIFSKPYNSYKSIKIEVDLFNYVKNLMCKNQQALIHQHLQKNGLASFKSEVGQLHIGKLETVPFPVDQKLNDVVDRYVVKNSI